jgi:hypothetical protein
MSNQRLEETLLLAVEEYIALAEKYIMEQERRIKILASIGRDTTRAEQILVRFNEVLQKIYAHRVEILAALNE